MAYVGNLDTPSILVLEDVFDCDTVFKTQIWLVLYKTIFI
jgi:hypothetical protein